MPGVWYAAATRGARMGRDAQPRASCVVYAHKEEAA